MLTQISEYSRIACLLAVPELVTCENYGKREDLKEFLDCIKSLKESGKKIAVQDELFRIQVKKMYDEAIEYNLFNIIRNDESTVDKTLKLLERHYCL